MTLSFVAASSVMPSSSISFTSYSPGVSGQRPVPSSALYQSSQFPFTLSALYFTEPFNSFASRYHTWFFVRVLHFEHYRGRVFEMRQVLLVDV